MDVTSISHSLVLPYTDYALLTGSNFCPLGHYHFHAIHIIARTIIIKSDLFWLYYVYNVVIHLPLLHAIASNQ